MSILFPYTLLVIYTYKLYKKHCILFSKIPL
ncbi:MAG: hypothetical protein [Podoviridae sp. ctLUJ1]|nr:MAG: hypothetical protein [Podoviridae sp. ctLUJ1]